MRTPNILKSIKELDTQHTQIKLSDGYTEHGKYAQISKVHKRARLFAFVVAVGFDRGILLGFRVLSGLRDERYVKLLSTLSAIY